MTLTKSAAIFLFLFGTVNVIAQTSDSVTVLITNAADQSKGPMYVALTKGSNRLSLLLAADSLAKVNNNVGAQAAINEELGYYYYRSDPQKSVQYNGKANTLFVRIGNKKRAAQTLQNIAFVYDEQLHNTPQATEYTKLAVLARTELKDTLAMANMIKYLGYLQGKTHDFNEAKKNEIEAIRLFTLKKVMFPVAVCYRDLATVYEEEHKPDSCIASILQAKKIWEENNKDTSRLFNANNILLRVYTNENKLQDAEIVFKQNESMINSNAMRNLQRSYSDLLDYYKICQSYFGKKKDDKIVKEYLAKYNELKGNLNQQGYHID